MHSGTALRTVMGTGHHTEKGTTMTAPTLDQATTLQRMHLIAAADPTVDGTCRHCGITGTATHPDDCAWVIAVRYVVDHYE